MMPMLTAIYPGTFDPPTLGHLNIIERAASLFSTLYVGVGENSRKTHSPCFSLEERAQFLKTLCRPLSNVQVILIDGLLADLILKNKIQLIIRGVRTGSEFDHEIEIAQVYKQLAHVETLAMFSELPISSSLTREIGLYGGSLKNLVPLEILDEVEKGLRN